MVLLLLEFSMPPPCEFERGVLLLRCRIHTTRQAGVTNTILFLRETILGANNITRDRIKKTRRECLPHPTHAYKRLRCGVRPSRQASIIPTTDTSTPTIYIYNACSPAHCKYSTVLWMEPAPKDPQPRRSPSSPFSYRKLEEEVYNLFIIKNCTVYIYF